MDSARLWSTNSTRMHTSIAKTIASKLSPSVVKSWGGGPRFVLLMGGPASGSGDQRGFLLSLFFSRGGAHNSRPIRTTSRLTASARLKRLIASSWKPSTGTPLQLPPLSCRLQLPLLLPSLASERTPMSIPHGSDSDLVSSVNERCFEEVQVSG